MRIFTYPDPFELKSNTELWDIITKHPHFCASDTLLQGLGTEYKRTSFGVMRTINSLVNKVLGDYVNNPRNDVQMFLDVSSYIRNMPDGEMKSAFRFNIANVVESIKFLIMLECDADKFADDITEEQKVLLDIYRTIIKLPCVEPFNDLKGMDKKKIIELAKLTINEEIEYLCNRDLDTAKRLGIRLPIATLQDGHTAITKIIADLEKKNQETPDLDLDSVSYDDDITNAQHILSLINNNNDELFDRIIVHGVHKITPEMYFLFRLLEKNGIEVIFLINYAKNLPNTYQTWHEVYDWCDTAFEYQADVDIASRKDNLGVSIAKVIEGKKMTLKPSEDVTVFSNLTSFTDREVRQTFKKSGEKLNKMKTQYYAVSGRTSNEILKIYFPEQFNEKPFLSYPIGQFILGIYQMWNFEKNTLCLDDKSLCECAVSNIYTCKINMFNLVNKIKLYFSDCETIEEYFERIKVLSDSIKIVNSNNKFKALEKLSFFNIKLGDLEEFKNFLIFINDTAKRLFKESDNTIDFGKHFGTLIEIVSTPALKGHTLSKTEKDLIDEITKKLSQCADGEILGNIEDVKDALAFYLSAKTKGDTSNWIVRDFEQIDGAVLLSRKTKARYYHFALLSNSHMTNQDDEVLSWPLTNEMFTSYTEVNSAIPVVTKGLLERRNFLKFSLFYGTFFTKKKVKLSYIEEENGLEQVPYYLLKILGMEMNPYKENEFTPFLDGNDTEKEMSPFSSMKVDEEGKELFSICPFKFMQNGVMKSAIEYSNEYHIKYFVSHFMYSYVKSILNRNDLTNTKKVQAEFKNLRRLFPFWDEVVFVDIENKASEELNNFAMNGTNPFTEIRYERRKENFLIAQWIDYSKKTKQMNFEKDGINEKIEFYMQSPQLYPSRKDLPHKKVCENCNFSEVCLRDYYDAVAAYEEDEIDV